MSHYWVVWWSWFTWVNAICNLLRKKSWEVTASLLGRFLSRCCFTLCITMEVEPRIAKKYKCHHCYSCKNYRDKGGETCLCVVFWLTRRSRVRAGRECVWGHPIAQATSYCLLPDTLWLGASKNAFTAGTVNLANLLSLPSIVKKIRTGSKNSQGT